jgi:transcriptional antiterminator NusG
VSDQIDSAVEYDEATDASEVTPEDEATPEEPEDGPLEAFRRELWAKPGDWFVVHTYSGMEKRVKQNLENRIISLNMEDYIHEIVVPTEEVAEIKNGQRKMVTRTVLPGYVLVRMDLTDESWSAVRHTPSVTGFVGHSHQPVPLSMTEVEDMLAPAVVAVAEAEAAAAAGDKSGHGQQPRRSRSRWPTSTCPTPSWSSMVRSRRCTRRSPRSTRSPRGSRPSSRSSAGRPRSS